MNRKIHAIFKREGHDVLMIDEALVRIKTKPLALGLGIPNSILLLESRLELWQDQSQIHVPSPQVQELGNTPNQKKHVRKKRYSFQQTTSVLKKGEGYATSRLNCYCFIWIDPVFSFFPIFVQAVSLILECFRICSRRTLLLEGS